PPRYRGKIIAPPARRLGAGDGEPGAPRGAVDDARIAPCNAAETGFGGDIVADIQRGEHGGGGENFYRLPFKPPHRGRNRIRPFGGERGYVIDRGPERQQRKRDDPAPEADRGERRDIQYFSTSGSLIPDDRQQHQDKAKEPGLVEMDHVLIKHQIPARERE